MTIQKFIEHIKKEMHKVIVGQDDVIEQICIAFLSGGHVLLEGVPGIAKTLIARTFAKIIGVVFNRVQFTPDLMPSDIIGTMIYHLGKSEFEFKKGPLFTNILLGDEINRASPKTQAALLEGMQEFQVTVEGTRHLLDKPFMVLATQNPIEFEGTFPLPEAQLDRFIIKIVMDYPDHDVEFAILEKFQAGFDSNDLDSVKFTTVIKADIKKCHDEFAKIKVDPNIMQYILSICRGTRNHPSIMVGVSTRAAIYLLNMAKYTAAADGRDYVIPDDVKKIALPVLRHRLILEANAEIEGYSNDDIIERILTEEKVPR